jgi:hypothetical protein
MPITGKEFFAPYAYVNGRRNLIKPVKIDGFDFAERLAAEGRILDEKLNNQLIVVSDIEIRENDITERVCEIFNFFNVECYHKDNLNQLLEKIDREAHPIYCNT